MLKTNYKRVALLLAGVLSASTLLAGCGNSHTPSGGNDASSSAADSGQNSAGDVVSFEVWTDPFDQYSQDWMQKWTDEFNQSHEDIQVTVQFVPGDVWDQKIKAAQAADIAPESWVINYKTIIQDAQMGKLLPLDDYIDAAAWEDLFPNVLEHIELNGKHYGYPMLVEPGNVLYYRKDMFEAAGLDPEKPPATWEELYSYCDVLTKDGVYGFQVPTLDGDVAWTSVAQQMNSAGHLAINDDWSQAAVTDQGYVDYVNFYKTLHEKGYVPAQALSDPFTVQPVAEGNVAMLVTGSWAIQIIKDQYPDVADQFGIGVMPTKDGDYTKPTATLGGYCFGIDAKAKHPEQVAEYISWMYAEEPAIMADFFKASMYSKFTPRQSVQAEIAKDTGAGSNPWISLISDKIIPYAIFEPQYAWDITMAPALAISRVILNGESAEDSLKQAEADINTYIANNNYAGTNPKSAQ